MNIRSATVLFIIFMALMTAQSRSAGTEFVHEDGFETRPALVTGRVILELTMPIPVNDRDAILANKSLLEAEGLQVADDGSWVIFPEVFPAGWLVRFGAVEAIATQDGSFDLDLSGEGAVIGGIFHPSHEDDVPVGTLARRDLVSQGQIPKPIVLELPFDGPCGMTVGPDNPAHCQVPGSSSSAGLGIFDTYPPTPRESNCEILDGWIDSDTSPLGSYFGSTCFSRVLNGFCPNEGGFGIFSAEICCFKNHKGRFCQELQPGDMELLDLPNDNLVILDDVTEFTVHSNANYGETLVTTWLDKGIGGQMPPKSDWFDGEAGSIKHWDITKFNAWSCGTNSRSQGADIYQADRVVTYETPRCLDQAPAADAKDQYRLSTRDGRKDFIVTFQLEQSFLWQFEGGGAVFDLAQELERGSRISDPEEVMGEFGCAGKHIHGAHPCTGASDPNPFACGHGIVTKLVE